jgi:hypothetical protein
MGKHIMKNKANVYVAVTFAVAIIVVGNLKRKK